MDGGNLVVVGIGASAGGIQAIKRFFEHVPADSGIAYVTVLHLSPDHDSQLAQVLQVSATIPVTQVEDHVAVEPNHAYVIPPNRSLSIVDGHLTLSEVSGFEQRRAPVDIFFRTLAESHRSSAVSVILSGTGADGSMGMKRVKEQGGICLAQKPDEAEHGDMPRHAIATGLVDDVLSVDEMPARILAYKATMGQLTLAEQQTEEPLSDEDALRGILTQLRSRTGHDFSNYKRGTVLRRISRRMGVRQVSTLSDYATFIRDHVDEPTVLLKDLLISVTNFFRDREAFDQLEQVVVPKLFQGKRDADQVRVWVAGCATGEEAYSIAMLLTERGETRPDPPSIQVFATDIDEAALSVARAGAYTLNDAADVTPERLRRFFVRDGNLYRVQKSLREMILFAHHNVLKDPPFAHLDLLSCRNLLIYLNRGAQRRALEVMHFALNVGGFLFLGSSESIEGSTDLFTTEEKQAHLFQSRPVVTRLPAPIADVDPPTFIDGTMSTERAVPQTARARLAAAEMHQRLVEAYAPPSVVITEDYEIAHLSERAGRYLQFAGGEPSHNLLKVIRPELRAEMRTAVYQAAQQRTSVETQPHSVRTDQGMVALKLVIRPVLRHGDPARGFFLVLFEEVDSPTATAATDMPAALTEGDATRRLEEEVERLRGQLRSSVERHETQAEELKASNEELQASNEELRSSTEELETSKEELQSANEELRTVNQELKNKVDEQTQSTNDMQNLVNSTEIATIFLDRSGRIKLFTPRARQIFTLIPTDRDRPLSDINHSLVDVDLQSDIEYVLHHLNRIEREIRTRDGRWELMRALPYRTADDRIAGIVLTFLDISERKRSEEQLHRTEQRFRQIIEGVTDYAIFTMDVAGIIDSWNPGASRLFGYSESEAVGLRLSIMFTPEDRDAGVPSREMAQAREDGRASDERWHLRKDGSRFFVSGVLESLRDDDGSVTGFVKIARDLTERRQAEESLRDAYAELEARVVQRTAELSAANTTLDAELQERRHAQERIRGLMRRLISIQEEERKRIGRDLHDHLGQQVSALGFKLDAASELGADNVALREILADARRAIAGLDHDLDYVTWELRPSLLDRLGLAAALDNYIREWSSEYGIAADFQSRGVEKGTLRPDAVINLYRIVQEALNNVHKHAEATRVDVILDRRGDHAVLVIEDNGKGFDPNAADQGNNRRIGLLGMEERAAFVDGVFRVESVRGRGTSVFVQVPAGDDRP